MKQLSHAKAILESKEEKFFSHQTNEIICMRRNASSFIGETLGSSVVGVGKSGSSILNFDGLFPVKISLRLAATPHLCMRFRHF